MFGNHEDFVFPLPANMFAKRLAQFYHEKYHRDMDTVVTQIRKEFWIVGLKRIVSVIDKNCKHCLIFQQKVASQVMGDLPTFRTELSAAFSQTSLDLCGSLLIKDSVVRRGTKVRKKAWLILFTCLLCRVKETFPDEEGRVRNVVVTVPPPSLSLLKGAQYSKKLSMIDLDRHVKNLIVIVPSPSSYIT